MKLKTGIAKTIKVKEDSKLSLNDHVDYHCNYYLEYHHSRI